MVPSDDALASRRSSVNCRRTARAGGGGLERLGRALLLNASFEPLCVVPMRRAVVLVLKDKAEIVARKEDRLSQECGLSLRRHPPAPHASLWLIATVGSIDPLWEPYLPDGDRVVA